MLEKSKTVYEIFLISLNKRIQQTQVKAALAVSQELIMLYRSIGQDIVTAQQENQPTP